MYERFLGLGRSSHLHFIENARPNLTDSVWRYAGSSCSVAVLIELCFDALGRVRNGARRSLGMSFSGYTADTVGLVLGVRMSVLELLDELLLTTGQLSGFFFRETLGTVFQHLECTGGIVGAVFIRSRELCLQHIQFMARFFELLHDDLTEFLQFLIR